MMIKKLCFVWMLAAIPVLGFCQTPQAKTINPKVICDDPYLHGEMVAYNEDFLQQGFTVDLFQVVQFPKNAYVPVRIHLEQGQMYQINFVANRFFQKVSITLMGKDKEQIFQEKFKGKTSQQHWFSKSMVAPYTGDYWVIMTQKAKDKDMVCGGLSVLKAGGGK